jgi:hypothetical protein
VATRSRFTEPTTVTRDMETRRYPLAIPTRTLAE